MNFKLFTLLSLAPLFLFADDQDQLAERGGERGRMPENRSFENKNFESHNFSNDAYRRDVPQYRGDAYIQSNPVYVMPEDSSNGEVYPYQNPNYPTN